MEENIQNYSPTGIFDGTPCTLNLVFSPFKFELLLSQV